MKHVKKIIMLFESKKQDKIRYNFIFNALIILQITLRKKI